MSLSIWRTILIYFIAYSLIMDSNEKYLYMLFMCRTIYIRAYTSFYQTKQRCKISINHFQIQDAVSKYLDFLFRLQIVQYRFLIACLDHRHYLYRAL